jgi:hypothetical protein
MGQQQSEATVSARRDASQVGSVQRRVIDADDDQLTLSCRNDGTLIHQQRDLVPIGELGIVFHRHTAVMVVIA